MLSLTVHMFRSVAPPADYLTPIPLRIPARTVLEIVSANTPLRGQLSCANVGDPDDEGKTLCRLGLLAPQSGGRDWPLWQRWRSWGGCSRGPPIGRGHV